MKSKESIFNKLGLTNKQALLLISAAVFSILVYSGSRILNKNMYHYDFTIALDNCIPLIPWTITIYIGSFVFWTFGYYFSTRYDKGNGFCFIGAHTIGSVISLIIFLIFPTVMTRPDVPVTSAFTWVLNVTYNCDTPDNLLPSFHCFASWLCFIGFRNNIHIPKKFQVLSCIYATAVCISTLTVKQHLFVDVPAGIILAELSYALSSIINKKE